MIIVLVVDFDVGMRLLAFPIRNELERTGRGAGLCFDLIF